MTICLKKSVVIASCTLLLAACQHDNPLKTHSKKQSAEFLMNASANAEKRLQFKVKEDEHGYGYVECMERKKNPEINCTTLYHSMIVFAKEKHYPGFETLTLANLTEQSVFDGLSTEYYEVMVSTWPKYFPKG